MPSLFGVGVLFEQTEARQRASFRQRDKQSGYFYILLCSRIMMMISMNEWYALYQQALEKKREWLMQTKIPELKAYFSEFRTAFSTLYAILLQKNAIVSDPYKSETAVGYLKMPETSPFFEPKKREAFSLRLARYDNQLEYITAFCDFSVDTLSTDKTKVLQAIIWFIEWKNLSLTSPSPNTQTMAEILLNLRKNTANKVLLNNLEACFEVLYETASHIDEIFDELTDYRREVYKGAIRSSIITATANADGVVTLEYVKAQFPRVFPEETFDPELVQAVLDEDYAPDARIRESILAKLAVPEYDAPADEKAHSVKATLIECLNVLGSTGGTFNEIIAKIEHNHGIYRRKKKSLGESISAFFAFLLKRKQATDFYECEIVNAVDSKIEIIDHYALVEELNRKVKELRTMSGYAEKGEKMTERELLDYLSRNIRDIQKYHRILIALDAFFKTKVDDKHKNHIKGIRPELATIKSAFSKAILKQEYCQINQK
jgi:hypothetical protein